MSKANSLATEAAMCYLERLESQPMGYWRSSEFAQLSYAKTAAREVVDLLKNDDSKPPLVIIEEYVDKMNKYACLNKERSICHENESAFQIYIHIHLYCSAWISCSYICKLQNRLQKCI